MCILRVCLAISLVHLVLGGNRTIVIPKCCPLGYTYGVNVTTWSCIHNPGKWNWNLTFQSNQTDPGVTLSPSKFKIKIWVPKCNLLRLDPIKFTSDQYYLNYAGALIVPEYGRIPPSWETGVYYFSHYCMEYDISDEGGAYKMDPNAYICFLMKGTRQHPLPLVLYPIGLILSDVSFVITGVIIIFGQKRNLFTKILLCNMVTFFLAYLFLTCIHLRGLRLPSPWCQILAVSMHYSFLSAFCWLTVMCFDVWYKLKIQLPPENDKKREMQFFLSYSAFAFGSPTVAVVIALILEYAPKIPTSVLRPLYGKGSCWLQGVASNFAYFYGPVAVLLFANMIFFILTMISVCKVARQTKMLWRKKEAEEYKRRLIMYIKLFVVMGMLWVFEVVSWVLERVIHSPQHYFYFTDFINTLHGVFLMLLFICKPNTCKLIRTKTVAFIQSRGPKTFNRISVESVNSVTSAPTRTSIMMTIHPSRSTFGRSISTVPVLDACHDSAKC